MTKDTTMTIVAGEQRKLEGSELETEPRQFFIEASP
jgi:hypothetical protein